MMDIGEVVKNNKTNNNHLGRETSSTPSSDFGLQWGNRKRLRCMKIQVKSDSTNTDKTKARINRGVVKHTTIKNSTTTTTVNNNNFNFRRPVSPPPPAHRISRNSETMKSQSNGGVKAANISPDRVVGEEKDHHKKGNNNNNNNGVVGGGASGSSETAQDSKKGGSSSGSGDTIPVWLPKFAIALTNKEKEEDFMAIKGSKLPQRPKKRAKFVQRTLNAKLLQNGVFCGMAFQKAEDLKELVSPGAWLCDLTLERYEVREKKVSKKRPRGLKAMGNMDSDSD